jgi:hypothetical protein
MDPLVSDSFDQQLRTDAGADTPSTDVMLRVLACY